MVMQCAVFTFEGTFEGFATGILTLNSSCGEFMRLVDKGRVGVLRRTLRVPTKKTTEKTPGVNKKPVDLRYRIRLAVTKKLVVTGFRWKSTLLCHRRRKGVLPS